MSYAKYSGLGGGSGGGSGTVTSVGLADGSTTPIYDISGSPVTSAGTLTFTLASQNANLIFAGPTSGGTSQPDFRSLVAADLPAAYQTVGNLTDAGTDGITITGGTNSVLGSGTSISQHVADSTHNGYLSSTDWTTFNNKQPAGNYITALTGDVTATGPGSVAATLASFVNRVYVDFLDGNDSTGTGTPVRPWKTLQHAYNSISPSINNPIAIFISGGNNDSDSTTITAKPNVALFGDYNIQVSQPLVVTGGTTNDLVWFENIIFVSTVTWIRNDASEISMYLVDTEITGALDFEQQGSGVSATYFNMQGGALGGGATLLVAQTNISTQSIYGALTFKDIAGSYYLINAPDLYTTAITINGGSFLYIYGSLPDTGYSITGVTTGTGTPTIIGDADSLPPTLSGSYTLQLVTQSQYVNYSPTTSSNWNSVPATSKEGLDTLAGSGIVKSQSQNLVLASPNGSSGVPSFRALVTADMPSGVVDALSAVGSSPNADAATISGNTLNLQPFDGTHPGVVTASGGGTTNFLRADGTWAVPPGGGGGSGTVTSVDMTVPGFLSVSGNPITTSGTLAVAYSGTALPAANGGTGLTSPGTAGNALISTGSAWTSAPISGSSAFAAYASSQVTTLTSTPITSSSFTTFDNSPAFTFTPTISGNYKVYCPISITFSGATQTAQLRIFNTSGSATLLYESQGVLEVNTVTNEECTIFCQSVYSLTAGTSYQFDIQGLTSGGTLYADGRGGGNGAPFYMFAEGVSLSLPIVPVTEVSASAYLSTNYTPAVNGIIIYDTKLYDTTSSYDASTGIFTCPVAGKYLISTTNLLSSGNDAILIQKNGSQLSYITNSSSTTRQSGAQVIDCMANDTISLVSAGGTTYAGSGSPYTSLLQISLIEINSLVPAIWNGYQTNSSGWSFSTSLTPVDATGVSGATLTTSNSTGMGTVTQALDGSSNPLPGIIFTPIYSGLYEITINTSGQAPPGLNNGALYTLTDGTNYFSSVGTNSKNSTFQAEPLSISAIVSASSATPFTIKMQAAADNTVEVGNTINTGRAYPGDISWSIKRVG